MGTESLEEKLARLDAMTAEEKTAFLQSLFGRADTSQAART